MRHGAAGPAGIVRPLGRPAVAGRLAAPEPLSPHGPEYFVNQVRRAQKVGEKVRADLHTKTDAERYVRSIRERIRESFGPFPEKTPLNARVTGIVERDAYHIEKVIFESRPEFLVTANLYVPKGRKFPLPGVVGTCGHSDNGKAAEAYQSFTQARPDGLRGADLRPAGPGRAAAISRPEAETRTRRERKRTPAGGEPAIPGGRVSRAWRAWDGIRALDYLLTRPEVDPRRWA